MNKLFLIWSNLFRRKVRTFLTVFSILIAFLLFTLLRTVTGAFEGDISLAGVDRLNVSPKYSIIDLLPVNHMNEISRIEGVAAITHQTWFGGSYQGLNNFFPKFPVEPLEYFAIYTEYQISEEHLQAFANTRTGAVVPVDMAEQYGWQVGDKIPIEGDIWLLENGSPLWEFDLVGTFSLGENETSMFQPFLFNYAYFDEARIEQAEGSVGWFTVRVTNPDDAPQIAAQIDSLFENSTNPTRSATEAEFTRQFAQQVGDIGLMMNGILSAVFFTILLLTGNTMTQALRERIPELAVLKTFGFSDATVSLLVLAESIVMCVVGGALGIGLAILMIDTIRPQVESFISPFQLSGQTIVSGLIIAVLLGFVVGIIPALTARRLQIADALRR